jgi:hypothetical protein
MQRRNFIALCRKLRQASFLLPKGMDGQKMKIRAGIETKGGIRRPVTGHLPNRQIRMAPPTIQLLRRDDSKWRKGV